MNEQEALSRMVAPGTPRPGKYRQGVIQIHITRACNQACFNCTQGSNLGGKTGFITVEQFRQACRSLKGYFGVVGMFGGNPAMHPQFAELCRVVREEVPLDQRGIWCNDPITVGNAMLMRATFTSAISNLNVHLDRAAYDRFKEGWPECCPVGLTEDSRHSPVHLAMKDMLWKVCPNCAGAGTIFIIDRVVQGQDYGPHEEGHVETCHTCERTGKVYDEPRAWEFISNCDINKHWSAMIGVFRGELRAWFCEVAGAQAVLHQDESDYPDTGLDPTVLYEHETAPGERLEKTVGAWWQLGMPSFSHQVRKHCHSCGVPLRGYGELAQSEHGVEQTSATHAPIYKPKRKGRQVEVVTDLVQLGVGRIQRTTQYLQNSKV